MIWTEDKIKHYSYCYDKCQEYFIKYKGKYRFLITCLVFLCVTVYKEIIHDLLLKMGNFELLDIYANLLGCYDSYISRKKRVEL